jgi:hypothetical protein
MAMSASGWVTVIAATDAPPKITSPAMRARRLPYRSPIAPPRSSSAANTRA